MLFNVDLKMQNYMQLHHVTLNKTNVFDYIIYLQGDKRVKRAFGFHLQIQLKRKKKQQQQQTKNQTHKTKQKQKNKNKNKNKNKTKQYLNLVLWRHIEATYPMHSDNEFSF